jgi:hypothetical protein
VRGFMHDDLSDKEQCVKGFKAFHGDEEDEADEDANEHDSKCEQIDQKLSAVQLQ